MQKWYESIHVFLGVYQICVILVPYTKGISYKPKFSKIPIIQFFLYYPDFHYPVPGLSRHKQFHAVRSRLLLHTAASQVI